MTDWREAPSFIGAYIVDFFSTPERVTATVLAI